MFTLSMTNYGWWYLVSSLVLFIGFALRIREAKEPFIEPALFKRKRFIFGVFVGGMLLGAVAGFMSMIPCMMREVLDSTSLIGVSIRFPEPLA